MSILKPQKILFNKLKRIENLNEEIYDDSLTDLEEYIEENGYNKGNFFVILGIGIIIICIELNEIRKKVSNQIDLIDKQEN